MSLQGCREFIQDNEIISVCEELRGNKMVDEMQNLSLQKCI